MICPHCHKPIADAAIRSEAGRLSQAKRKVRAAGPGAPRKQPRCECERFTLTYARKRKHNCKLGEMK